MATTALITGAGGLIGSWVIRHWDFSITALPIRRADIDLLVPGTPTALVEAVKPDHVVHLAWCASGSAGYRHSKDNHRWLNATLELHRACLNTGARLWATGTIVDLDPDPSDAYALAKSALREELSEAIATGGVGWLRPHYVFDELAARPALVAHALEAKARQQTVELQTPHSVHDFIHASDVGRAIVGAIGHDLTGELPIGSGTKHSVSDLVTCLGVPWRAPESVSQNPASHVGSGADVSRLTNIDWTPIRTEEFFAHGT